MLSSVWTALHKKLSFSRISLVNVNKSVVSHPIYLYAPDEIMFLFVSYAKISLFFPKIFNLKKVAIFTVFYFLL